MGGGGGVTVQTDTRTVEGVMGFELYCFVCTDPESGRVKALTDWYRPVPGAGGPRVSRISKQIKRFLPLAEVNITSFTPI